MSEADESVSTDEVNEYLSSQVGLSAEHGMVVDHVEPGRALLRAVYDQNNLRPGGIISGPTLMRLVDLAGWVIVFSKAGIEPMAVTWDLKINFLRAAQGGDVIAEARLLKFGRKLVYSDVTMWVEGTPDKIVAHATITYARPDPAS